MIRAITMGAALFCASLAHATPTAEQRARIDDLWSVFRAEEQLFLSCIDYFEALNVDDVVAQYHEMSSDAYLLLHDAGYPVEEIQELTVTNSITAIMGPYASDQEALDLFCAANPKALELFAAGTYIDLPAAISAVLS